MKTRPFHEITRADVGKAWLRLFGRVWPVADFIGRILPMDVGKRIYLCDDIVQVENDEQRDARLGNVKRNPGDEFSDYPPSDRDLLRQMKPLLRSCGEYYEWSISGNSYDLSETLTASEIRRFINDYIYNLTDREMFEEWEGKATGEATKWSDDDFDEDGRYGDALNVYDTYLFKTRDGGMVIWEFSVSYGGDYDEVDPPWSQDDSPQAGELLELLEKWPSDVDTLLEGLGGHMVSKDEPAAAFE